MKYIYSSWEIKDAPFHAVLFSYIHGKCGIKTKTTLWIAFKGAIIVVKK